MRNKVWGIFTLIALLVLAGCQSAPPVPENAGRNLATPFTDELPEADQRTRASIDAHVVALARIDLAQKQGIDADSIFVQSVEETEFSDASLGVPEPGVMYAQVVTPGYVIRLIVGGKVYRYHASGDRVVLVPDRETPGQETPRDTIAVTVFLSNQSLDRTGECDVVFPVVREVPHIYDLPRVALEQLFAGLTEAEMSQGYTSSFSKVTEDILKSFRIKGDTAYVNLVDIRPLMLSANASCGQQAFFAQVETTLRQARPVARVIYAIEGDPALFYEWMQLGCSEANDYCDRAPFEVETNGMAPEEVVSSFYSWYLDQAGGGGNALVSRAYRSNEHLSQAFIRKVDDIIASSDRGGYDPFLCAQDIPRDMRLDPAVATEDSARVGVHGIWNPGTQYESSNDILILLQRVDGRWQIADIDCSWRQSGDRANSNGSHTWQAEQTAPLERLKSAAVR